MKLKPIIKSELIAPCGMNCAICMGHLRDKNKCPGCRKMSDGNSDYCKKCIIKHCDFLEEEKMKFCSDRCRRYPCARLKSLDKRNLSSAEAAIIEKIKIIADEIEEYRDELKARD